MLDELYIENLAVIEKASVCFDGKLNVFTGETGAGKSILINGINALLGQRTTKDIVRTGAARALVSGSFSQLSEECLKKLDELSIQPDEDGKLLLTREIRADGGSTARINSRPVNVSLIREIGNMLVNIHGQHDNQILLSPERHIDILDSYADARAVKEEYHALFSELQQISRKISRIKKEQAGKNIRISRLKEIVAELESLDIKQGEDEEIERELELSKNAVFLTEAVMSARRLLSGDEDDSGAEGLISAAAKQIESGTDIMPEISALYERILSISIEAADISSELDSAADKLNADPKRFEWLNSRARELDKAKMSYGPSLDDVIRTLEASKTELEEIGGYEQDLVGLVRQQKQLLRDTSVKAAELTSFRKKAAERFSEQIAAQLEFLNMPQVSFIVDIKQGKLTANGMDTVEFLISANLGEAPRPIAKIASGGELSRIMLAIKSVIGEKDSIGTLIFDEIDTGVSGRAAQRIGLKLRELSRSRQVLCVTHLSQIAVMADAHMLIEKSTADGRTSTSITPLTHEQRKREIARIIGGDNITEITLENAEQLLSEVK